MPLLTRHPRPDRVFGAVDTVLPISRGNTILNEVRAGCKTFRHFSCCQTGARPLKLMVMACDDGMVATTILRSFEGDSRSPVGALFNHY